MSKLTHSFSVSVACVLDINRAIILQHLIFLQDGTDDGWVRKSNAAMRETYPYLSPKQVRGALDRMEADGLLFSRIDNEKKADRTKSYFVTPDGRNIYGLKPFALSANALCQKGKSDVAKRANEMLPKGQMQYRGNIIDNIVDNVIEENAREKQISVSSTADFPPFPQVPAAPLPPQGIVDTWVENLTTNFRVKEGFCMGAKIPERYFDEYVTRFTAIARATPEEYNRQSDVTRHFINWSRIEYQKNAVPSANPPKRATIQHLPNNRPEFSEPQKF